MLGGALSIYPWWLCLFVYDLGALVFSLSTQMICFSLLALNHY